MFSAVEIRKYLLGVTKPFLHCAGPRSRRLFASHGLQNLLIYQPGMVLCRADRSILRFQEYQDMYIEGRLVPVSSMITTSNFPYIHKAKRIQKVTSTLQI